MDTETKINNRLLGFLVTPSLLSGVFVAFISLGLVLAIIISGQLSGSNIRQEYLNYQAAKTTTTTSDYAPDNTTQALISSAPLMVFWSLIGVVVYLLAVNIITAIQHAKEVQDELDYVNTNRKGLLKTVAVHFLIRCVVVAVWIPYILFFLHWVIPYVLTAANAGSMLTFDGIGVAALAILILAVSLHIHVVFARLLLLKPRIFSRALYVA